MRPDPRPAPARSLRLRLTGIILGPLLVIGLLIALWQWREARLEAEDLFDRSLLTTALAVAGDVARSGGDALSLDTRDLLNDTSGGPVYYHAYAPDGVYVTGFATPPIPPAGTESVRERVRGGRPYVFYTSTYQGREVRVLRLTQVSTVDRFSGSFTYTVWQDLALRDGMVRAMAARTLTVIGLLIGAVALIVWFGVRFGLSPLLDLEDAISRRSSDDLSPIRRPVPVEAQGLVARLNRLFGQVTATMTAQSSFISDAAHQLRNPIAGVQAMAEAVQSAPTPDDARRRAAELLSSARSVSDLADKLLTLERASAAGGPLVELSADRLCRDLVQEMTPRAEAVGARLSYAPNDGAERLILRADAVMLAEALTNLMDNSLRHGGPDLTRVTLHLDGDAGTAHFAVEDDGKGLSQADMARARERFGQAAGSEGTGLGLPIAEAVAQAQGGDLTMARNATGGLTVTLSLPRAPDLTAQRPAA